MVCVLSCYLYYLPLGGGCLVGVVVGYFVVVGVVWCLICVCLCVVWCGAWCCYVVYGSGIL